MKRAKYVDLEKELAAWIDSDRAEGNSVSQEDIKNHALAIWADKYQLLYPGKSLTIFKIFNLKSNNFLNSNHFQSINLIKNFNTQISTSQHLMDGWYLYEAS